MLFRRTRQHRTRCRTIDGGREVLDVTAYTDQRGPAVLLRVHGVDTAVLSPMEVGRLRGLLRDVLYIAVNEDEQSRGEQDRQRA